MNETFINVPNCHQRQAIETIEGPLLIIAGPGSGKTFTLVERIVHVITTLNAAPESLLVLTFTNKAASELRTRISNRLLERKVRFDLEAMYLGTFHAVCLRWLEEHRERTRLRRSFVLMDPTDQHFFLYRRLDDYLAIPGVEIIMGRRDLGRWKRSGKLLDWINSVSEEALDPAPLIAARDLRVQALGRCYELYQAQMAEENTLDFATIQYEALRVGLNIGVGEEKSCLVRIGACSKRNHPTKQEASIVARNGNRPKQTVHK